MKLALGSIAAACAAVSLSQVAVAAPYASGVTIAGTTVSFVLNEGGSTLSYSLNGGAPVALDGTTKGTKTFTLNSPTDKFSITASKTSSGYTVMNGTSTPAPATGLGAATNNGGAVLVSSDNNTLGRFNSPRGVAVNLNPNAGAFFGTAYVANSAAGTVAANAGLGTAARTLGDGLYALKSDQSDAFGYVDTAHPTTAEGAPSTWTATASAPYRLSVGADNNVYVADFGDASSVVGFATPTLNGFSQVLAGTGGTFPIANTQNHGSTTAIAATGSIAAGNLVLYTLDEDITAAQAGGTGSGRNNLLRYNVGAGLNSTVAPVKVNQNPILLDLANSDFELASNGKFYVGQNRASGTDGAGVFVLNADGSTAFDSLTTSRTLLNDPAAADILRNVQGIAVSPDLKFIALMLNNSDVAIVPLDANGLPIIANRVLIDTGTDVISGRDIAFDAADNVYYVSSGQALYRVYSPGGRQSSTLSYDGTQFSFVAVVPEPTTLVATLAGVGGLMLRRRRAR